MRWTTGHISELENGRVSPTAPTLSWCPRRSRSPRPVAVAELFADDGFRRGGSGRHQDHAGRRCFRRPVVELANLTALWAQPATITRRCRPTSHPYRPPALAGRRYAHADREGLRRGRGPRRNALRLRPLHRQPCQPRKHGADPTRGRERGVATEASDRSRAASRRRLRAMATIEAYPPLGGRQARQSRGRRAPRSDSPG